MSDATATATAIPREINLGLQKPVATPAYTRRFKSQAQNPEAAAGTQATITLDTAQPGSFIDTLDSYLSFRLRLTNPSTTRGYNVSFSSCGAQGLIRAMRIYVQGVPIEEITEYNALVEWLHDLSGIPDYCDRSAKSRYLANTMNDDYFVYLPAGQEREIAIQLPLVSGVLGTMADKMFPSMLVAPGNCYIQLDLATAQNALRIQEVDVTSLTVGTGGVRGTDGADAPIFDVSSSVAPSVAAATEVLDSSTVASMVNFVSGKQILEEQPYDCPFVKGANYAGATRVGILTTEERIGGGIFGPQTSQPSATEIYFVGNKKIAGVVSGAGNSTQVATPNVSAQSGPNSTASVFLGSGLNATGSIMAQSDKKMNVASIPVTYTIVGLEYIGKQVVVGDDVARAIIERAAAGDISIHTQSYRQYPHTISLNSGWNYRLDPAYVSSTSSQAMAPVSGNPLVNMYQRYNSPGAQSIVIPAKISSANAIYHIFRNGTGLDDYQFDSLRRMTIGFRDGVAGGGATVNAQLRIGNELIPQSPIQTASEALEELLKAHHMDGFYGTCEKMGSLVGSSYQQEWPKPSGLMITRGAGPAIAADNVEFATRDTTVDVGTTALAAEGGLQYVRNDFNSQILCPNPDSVSFVYPAFESYYGTTIPADRDGFIFTSRLGINTAGSSTIGAFTFYRDSSSSLVGNPTHAYGLFAAGGSGATLATTTYPESPLEYADRQARWKKAVRKAFFGYADERSNHQIVDPKKSNFLNPYKQHTGRYSTFMLGFDLDTFSHNTETIRSGHYLGNNTVSLNLSNVEFVDNSPLNQALCSVVRMDTYVLHDLRLSFQAGGIVQAFY
jgi:hypothetical protein